MSFAVIFNLNRIPFIIMHWHFRWKVGIFTTTTESAVESNQFNIICDDRFKWISVQWEFNCDTILALTCRYSSHEDQHYYCQAWFSAICDKESTIGFWNANSQSQWLQKEFASISIHISKKHKNLNDINKKIKSQSNSRICLKSLRFHT